ncbi:TRAP transporter substrate-binding protein [Paracoccus denitrificans]|jgi:TRAP-type C4-dicarboxylate transport system substrate-binding protein|uniref:TRAP dicarboxylate transporter-DctP subunit n=1 Tax=Paracoccus denitrificans (strain Pd 1222) TaxID=318586 RepID=A1B7S3_PARDP|nr:TRAP transporter substrate-binding protein [Paracoccus denitrificans]ABL71567.1 TRAP dicarboxylate transporter- DctP subunit [Paracoccus denitrificans PD1222]MBB4628733.1 TRAP-type C4-dicarboxylate transport system substrate-binding protein [Paracoccus denitrificans]MCU7429872.1 TRAP transporter substrate-binding protein [Paracoccus denitrificans]QAR28166.1 TRAP transporter substrate-binding protein [Paracoccus denitrificans]UPV97898.1 TRAP transporter substrate-binding protein [Paracoccus 
MKTLILSAIASLSLGGAAFAADVTLRVHHFLSADAPLQTEILIPWEKAVEEQSGGRIDVQLFPSMQLGGKPPQLFDQARDGIVDISWTLLGYTPGRFPVAEVFELPFMSGTAVQTTAALQDFQAKYLGDEMGQVKPLLLHAPAGYKFHMRSGPITSLADLKGKKIRAPSRAMTDALNALGATAVGMPVPEVAQALTTGVIDGAQIPWEVVGSLRVNEITNAHSEIGVENGGVSTAVMALVMNRAKYDSLPDDLKKVIDDNSGANLAVLAGEALDRVEAEERQKALDAGAQINVIPAEQMEEWRSAVQPVVDGWVKAMDGRGLDGQAMLDDARAMLAAAGAE